MSPTQKKFENDIDQIWAAYAVAIAGLPTRVPSKVTWGPTIVTFTEKAHVDCVVVELGWAFFGRLDSCFETLLQKRLEVGLCKKFSLLDYCKQEDITLTEHQQHGVTYGRKIRNLLHHADGDEI